MTFSQQIITIVIVATGTMLTRVLPFLLFPEERPTPPYVRYLGKVLPSAVFGLLIIYCLKNVSLFSDSHGCLSFYLSALWQGSIFGKGKCSSPLPEGLSFICFWFSFCFNL